MSEKISSIRGIIDQPTEPDVGINLFPDGNQVDIDIDRTTLKVTKSSFNITIGRFSISLNNKETENPSPDHSSDRELTRQTSIFVISVHTGHPLLVVKEEDSTSVTADISFSKLIAIIIIMVYDGPLIAYAARRDHLHLVDTRSTGQGNRSTLTASKNNYFLAVDITGSVKVLERDSNNANNQVM